LETTLSPGCNGVYKRTGQEPGINHYGNRRDGIEPIGNGDYIVSCWPGLIYYLGKDGTMQVMLDTRELKRNTADIGYDAKEQIVYVPTFFKKSVVAYKLK
jgi:hypothetical protein